MFATIFSKWHHLTEISRDLWKWYSYRDYGIIAEPYFDLDFSRVLYLTDTGRRWDGDKVSVRDRAHQSVLASAGGLGQVPDGQSLDPGDVNVEKPGQASVGQSHHTGDVNTEESGQASEGWSRRPGNVNNEGSGQGSEEKVSRAGSANTAGSGEASVEQGRRPDRANADGAGQKSKEQGKNPHDAAMDDHIEGQRPLSELYSFRSTADLMDACRNDQLPSQMMINFHPQRWTDDSIPWIREWLMQNVKNVAKRGLIWVRG